MIELDFAPIAQSAEDVASLQQLMDLFEHQSGIRVNLIPVLWNQGWSEIVKTAIYRHGADVSEIGASWISSVASMSSLRPFSPEDVQAIGGAGSFLDAMWQTGIMPGDSQVWAIPWLAYPLMVYFRRDWLDQAGIVDQEAAFKDAASFEQTLAVLRERGMAHPLALTTHRTAVVLHEAACWVWGRGSDFLSADGKQLLVNQPEALEGLRAYFNLRRYISPGSSQSIDPASQFLKGQAAVAVNGPSLYVSEHEQNPGFEECTGMAPVPGVPYIGGASLVVWAHSRRPEAAVELVRFLVSQAIGLRAAPHDVLMPTRLEILKKLAKLDPFLASFERAFGLGRTFPTAWIWGAIEDKLINAFSAIWAEILANPFIDVDTVLHKYLDPTVNRLNLTLGS